jgi:3-phosphoshikimate 1-carboxyvinyltransferase
LGAEIGMDGTTLRIKGTPQFRTGVKLDCGNSGTTMRLLTGFIAGKGIDAELYGDSSLSSRPMERVASPLSLLGACVRTTDGHAPVYVSPAPLHGETIKMNVASAQVKSAILLAGLSADGETTVIERQKTRDHTERLLAQMGGDITVNNDKITVRKSALKGVDVCVPADISSAAYFMALGALKGKTLCHNVQLNPTRTGILTAFDRLWVKYTLLNKRTSGGEETADVLVEKSPMRAIEIGEEDIASMIDELPLIALLCAFAEGESRIRGAKELRFKESDRIRSTSEMITALGGDCIETEDGFVIRGKKKLVGGDVRTHLDHRIAMTATVGLIASVQGGSIDSEECCAISFPSFFREIGLDR